MATYTTDDSTTIREDLADRIAIINPNDVPLHHLLAKETCHNVTYEWAMDDVAAENPLNTSTDFATVQGADATYPTLVARQRAANYTHIVSRAAQVSDTERKVLEAGVEDEFSYQIYKKFLEVLKQADYNLHYSEYQLLVAGSLPSRTHGILQWLHQCGVTAQTSVTIAGQSINTATYRSTFYDNASANITRIIMHDNLLQPAHIGGMDLSGAIALVPSQIKRLISEFTAVYDSGSTVDTVMPLNERNIPARDRTLIDTIDVFETDFGTVYMNIDRRMNHAATSMGFGTVVPESGFNTGIEAEDETMAILDPTMFRIRVLEPLSFIPLAKTGLSTKGMVAYNFGAQVDNPKAGILGIGMHA